VLQHCRLAQKRAKNLGRDRVTIRIVFNSGQFVEWTCRWQDLDVLQRYCDRNGASWGNTPNWAHIFTDWAQLKARHAIPSRHNPTAGDDTVAIEFFELYFPGYRQTLLTQAADILGPKNDPLAMIEWINGAIHTGWYLAADRG
jgi:CRISPR-associated protein Cmr2